MKRLLVPIDGSERSITSVEAIKSIFQPNQVKITLLTVREDFDSTSALILEGMKKETMPILDKVADQLSDYEVEKTVEIGIAGSVILRYAMHHKIDMIVITKHTHKALSVFLGSVAVHVVKYAHCPVIVLPEPDKA
jgi:nucleotide-binding universal stress UspA family protein